MTIDLVCRYYGVLLALILLNGEAFGEGRFLGLRHRYNAYEQSKAEYTASAKAGCEAYRKTFVDGFNVKLQFQTWNLQDLEDIRNHSVELNAKAEVLECRGTGAHRGILERFAFGLERGWTVSLPEIEGQESVKVVGKTNARFVGSFAYGYRAAAWEMPDQWFYLETPKDFFTKVLSSIDLENFEPTSEIKERPFAFFFLDYNDRSTATFIRLGTVTNKSTGKRYSLSMFRSKISGKN